MMNEFKYFIAVQVEEDGKLIEKYYANDERSGGYPYFDDYIRYHEVRAFKSIEDIKKFLKKEYNEETNSFNACYHKFVGKPYVVELVLNRIEL